MRKDIEWLKEEIDELPCVDTVFNSDDSSYIYSAVPVMAVYDLIDKLDEPEVLLWEETINMVLDDLKAHIIEQQALSQNVGLKHTSAGNDTHYRQYDYVLECINEYEPSDYLQNLLVPKQEELEVKIQELIESYKQVGDAFSELENVWISGFIKDLKNLVEKEQKYYVLDSEDIPLLERANNQTYKSITGLSIYEDGRDNSRFELTEQEIKEYDERFWAFAVEVAE